jgi:hypothetical protein
VPRAFVLDDGTPRPALAVQRRRAAEALDISPDTFDRWVRPDLPVVYIGGVQVWLIDHRRRWLERNACGTIAVNPKRPRAAETAGGMAHGGIAP